MTAWRSSVSAKPVKIVVNGVAMTANDGEPLAAALVAGAGWQTRKTRTGQERGPFCFIGMCQECVVTVDNQRKVRSCLMPVAEGMTITLET
jgi:aerobic-type carbon monoxide dehydrogenase small subunit (CoxS/CutS family)